MDTSAAAADRAPLRFVMVLAGVGAIALVAGMFPLPVPYYTFLRYLVTVAALAAAWAGGSLAAHLWPGRHAHHEGSVSRDRLLVWWFVGLPGLAVMAALFNPVLPVYLGSRRDWRPFDLACAVVLAFAALALWPLVTGDAEPSTAEAFAAFVTVTSWVAGSAVFIAAVVWMSSSTPRGPPDCGATYLPLSDC